MSRRKYRTKKYVQNTHVTNTTSRSFFTRMLVQLLVSSEIFRKKKYGIALYELWYGTRWTRKNSVKKKCHPCMHRVKHVACHSRQQKSSLQARAKKSFNKTKKEKRKNSHLRWRSVKKRWGGSKEAKGWKMRKKDGAMTTGNTRQGSASKKQISGPATKKISGPASNVDQVPDARPTTAVAGSDSRPPTRQVSFVS